MSFWSFLRDIFLLDWVFGKSHRRNISTIHYNNGTDNDLGCDCEHYDKPYRSSGYSYGSRYDGHYASDDYSCDLHDDYSCDPHDDYCHDSQDDYAHDFDDFDDFDDEY